MRINRIHLSVGEKRIPTAGAVFLMCVSLFFGCAATNYGSSKVSQEVTQMFENNEVLPDHRYYYSGFETIPYAIIGIHERYTLRSNIWKDLDLTPTLLQQWTYRMKHVYRSNPRGAWILDTNGNKVGVWYSSERATTVRMEKDNRIVMVAPKPPDLRGGP